MSDIIFCINDQSTFYRRHSIIWMKDHDLQTSKMIFSKSLRIFYKLSAFKLYVFLIKQQNPHIVDIKDQELSTSHIDYVWVLLFDQEREFNDLVKILRNRSLDFNKVIDSQHDHWHSSRPSTLIKIIDIHQNYQFSTRSSIFIAIIDSHHDHRLSSRSLIFITIINFHHDHWSSSPSSILITIIDFHHDHRFSSRSSILTLWRLLWIRELSNSEHESSRIQSKRCLSL